MIAQFFGFLALITYLISFFKENRTSILRLILICNVLYSLQYLMLDAYAALFICIIGGLRTLIFLKFEKENKEVPLWVLLLIIGITIYSGFLSYNGLISLIPILTGIMYTAAMWQKDLKTYRIACIMNAVAWIIYNFKVAAYVSVISSIIETVIAITAYLKLNVLKKEKRKV